jgi:hypothetical protein
MNFLAWVECLNLVSIAAEQRWPNEIESLRRAHHLAKRTQSGVRGAPFLTPPLAPLHAAMFLFCSNAAERKTQAESLFASCAKPIIGRASRKPLWSLSGQEWRGYTANLVETILAGNPP